MKHLLATAALAALTAGPASAALFDYGDFAGSTVMFLDVEENTSVSPVALFGAPDVLGDSLDFDPVNFDVQVSGADADMLSSTVGTTIMATSGFLDLIDLNETGSYTLNGLSGNATADVSAIASVDILEVDGVPINTDVSFQQMFTFSPSGGSFSILEDGTGTATFSGGTVIDLDAALASAGIVGNATKIELLVTNTLAVASVSGTSARIEKDDFGGLVVTVVPEPASASLLGLGALAMLRRRR